MKALLLLVLTLFLAEGEPPTPQQRVAELKRRCATRRVELGDRSRKRKLGTDARAHFLAALHLDRSNRTARSRLGHRKGKDGTWSREREKTFADGKGAREKNGENQYRDEIAVVRSEAAAFAELGAALMAENHIDVARPLLLRASFLDPANAAAARGLLLVPIHTGFGTLEDAEHVRAAPTASKADIQGHLSRTVGTRTTVMACGSVLAESPTGGSPLGELARLGDQVQRLTSRRFSLTPRGLSWMMLVVARGQPQFHTFVDRCGLPEPRRSTCKRLGFLRMWQPRPFISTFVVPMADVRNARLRLNHALAEMVLRNSGGPHVPAWILEAAGMDANLTFSGRPGPLCVVYEESTGLRQKEQLGDPAGWPALLLRRAATGRIARLEHMISAQFQALGTEDVITAHAYYRLLHLTRRKGLGGYVAAHKVSKDSAANFQASFGITPDHLTEELRTVLLGSPPIVPPGRPAGK
ncbi:MAG: hypothetical protein ABFS86_05965 [Planctomycetota bacterium]